METTSFWFGAIITPFYAAWKRISHLLFSSSLYFQVDKRLADVEKLIEEKLSLQMELEKKKKEVYLLIK